MSNLETILNIRVEGTSQMVKLKDQINQTEAGIKKLKDAQKKAGKDGKDFTSSIVQAETKLKGMRKELNANKNDLLKLSSATAATGKSYNDLTKKNAALSVSLRKLNDPLGKNKKEFDALSGKMNKNTEALKKMDAQMGRQQRNVGNYGSAISGMALKIGGAVMAFKTLERAMSVFVDFEFQIKQVGIISGATAEQMTMLSDQAKELGSTTAFTAGEVAGLQKELAKIGFDASEITNMTGSILDLSFAFGDDLSQTAEQTGVVLKAFNLNASETSRVTDVMAAAFSNTMLDLEKFSVGMPKVASIAKTMGFSFEDTTTLLAALADTGMEASTSATALKNIFLKLADPAGALAQELGANITSVDELVPALQKLSASGVDVAGMLELTDKRSVTAFASLLDGSVKVGELNKVIKDSAGLTEKFANVMRDSLKGSIDETKSAAEGFALELFESLSPAITAILNTLQLLFASLKSLTPVIIGAATAFTVYKTAMVASRIATTLYAAGVVVARVATIAMSNGTRGLTLSMKALNLAMKANPIGLVVGIAAGAIAMFSSMGDETKEVTKEMKAMNAETERMKTLTEGLDKSQAKELTNVTRLISEIKNENRSRKDRLASVKALNEIAGTNITNISNEKKLTKELAGAYKDAVKAIENKYILQLANGQVEGLFIKELALKKKLKRAQDAENLALKERNEVAEINAKNSKDENNIKNQTIQMIDLEGNVISQNLDVKKRDGNRTVQNTKHEEFYQEAVSKSEGIIKEINKIQDEKNDIMKEAQKVVGTLTKSTSSLNDEEEETLTAYEDLKLAVEVANTDLQTTIELQVRGKATSEEVAKATQTLRKAKEDLNKVDKEVIKINKELDAEFREAVDVNADKIVSTQKQIDADQKLLDSIQNLSDNGAKLSKEIIEQSIKVAKAKLQMALITINADDSSTDAQVDNINRLKGELDTFEAQLKNMGGSTPAAGWLNKSLFGTGADGDDTNDYTGGKFLEDITATLGGVMGVLDEVSNLQHARLDGELGVIEKAKSEEIEAFKKTAEFKVMSTEKQDEALEKISFKHDQKMLALKVAQFERDQTMNIAQALMAGSMAIMQIWSSSATGNVIADNIIKGILTAAQVAMTGLQLTTIKAQKPPTAEIGGVVNESFAVGGMVIGNSHKNGGEKFAVGGRVVELEGGEAVINKKSTAMFRPMLSSMNVAGGGRKFADGGMVFATDQMETEANNLENLMATNEPQEVLLVEASVTNSQRSVSNIEAKASF